MSDCTTWSAGRETPDFTGKERAALEPTEAATPAGRPPDPVTAEIWNAAGDHFDECQLSASVLMIALTNCANRINATIRHSPEGEIS
jgi:alkylhydroperoxidase family enzyme